MWQVDNQTPFAAGCAWVRDRNGAEVWLVAVKCTFDIRPDGSTVVSNEQPKVLHVPEYHAGPDSSIKYDADLVRTKATTDVTVVGHAYAPGGRPVTRMDVAFAVGPVRKTLRVTGDRVWQGFGISDPEPFARMPLVYERAYGGVDRRSPTPDRDWDWRNPIGTGFAVSRDHATGLALPNIEYPGDMVGSWKDRPRPAGVGPVASHWQPRAGLAGTYDEQWSRHRSPLLPDDFDDRFFQCAPADQQAPSFLHGGEPVTLAGLTPSGELRFVVPKLFLGFDTLFSGAGRELHKERRLHSVIVEPDVPRVSLVWHSALTCHARVHTLDRTIVTVKTEVGGRPSAQEPYAFEPA